MGNEVEPKQHLVRKGCIKNPYGFTLLEILFGVIILGTLAIIIVPQVYFSKEQTRLNTLKTNLTTVRGAIELYYYQHHHIYPGAHDGRGEPASNTAQAEKAFIAQLTRYTDINGKVANRKDGTYKFGPYLESSQLPLNPYNNNNDVVCDITTPDISARRSDGSSGWKFYTKTGYFHANDGAHDDF